METSYNTCVMNTYSRYPVKIVKGKGCYVWDDKGNQYLDFTSGIATCNLGHVPDNVKKALADQLENLWHCSNLYHIEPQEKLAARLVKMSCFDQVFFANSGAEANEAAIKLARIYANKRDRSTEIVTFKQSFHGRTLATLTATGQDKIQTGFAPLMPGFTYLTFNDFSDLEKLKQIKPAAVMLELVQGEGGVHVAEQEWIKQLASVCKEENILMIVDEVQTGMGRTGKLFAYEHYQIEPDIMTLAKGLGSGFPIGAMLAKKEVAGDFTPGSHGSTFGGNPLATTAGLATLQTLEETNILSESKKQMDGLLANLQVLKEEFPFIKDVRGLGFLLGMEIDGEAGTLVERALKEKLLILTAGPKVLRILPPLITTGSDIHLFITRMKILADYAKSCHSVSAH